MKKCADVAPLRAVRAADGKVHPISGDVGVVHAKQRVDRPTLIDRGPVTDPKRHSEVHGAELPDVVSEIEVLDRAGNGGVIEEI